MVWLYERGGDVVQVETRFDNEANAYKLFVRWPTGEDWREEYPDLESFRQRLNELTATLEEQNWNQAGQPHLLQDGWRKPSAH